MTRLCLGTVPAYFKLESFCRRSIVFGGVTLSAQGRKATELSCCSTCSLQIILEPRVLFSVSVLWSGFRLFQKEISVVLEAAVLHVLQSFQLLQKDGLLFRN